MVKLKSNLDSGFWNFEAFFQLFPNFGDENHQIPKITSFFIIIKKYFIIILVKFSQQESKYDRFFAIFCQLTKYGSF